MRHGSKLNKSRQSRQGILVGIFPLNSSCTEVIINVSVQQELEANFESHSLPRNRIGTKGNCWAAGRHRKFAGERICRQAPRQAHQAARPRPDPTQENGPAAQRTLRSHALKPKARGELLPSSSQRNSVPGPSQSNEDGQISGLASQSGRRRAHGSPCARDWNDFLNFRQPDHAVHKIDGGILHSVRDFFERVPGGAPDGGQGGAPDGGTGGGTDGGTGGAPDGGQGGAPDGGTGGGTDGGTGGVPDGAPDGGVPDGGQGGVLGGGTGGVQGGVLGGVPGGVPDGAPDSTPGGVPDGGYLFAGRDSARHIRYFSEISEIFGVLLESRAQVQKRRRMHPDEPVETHKRPPHFDFRRGLCPRKPEYELSKQLPAPVIIFDSVVPNAQKRAQDGARAFRMVAVFFAGNVGHGLHHAHALFAGFVLAGPERECFPVVHGSLLQWALKPGRGAWSHTRPG